MEKVMATIQNMLEVCGTLEKAEKFAREKGPDYYLDLQLCLAAQGKWDEAKKINALRKPTDGRQIYASGLFSIMEGNLPMGMYQMHCGRSEGLFGTPYPIPGKMLTPDIEDIEGKVILLRSEGGFGDEIINVRFAKTLADRGAKVVVSANVGLASIFSRVEGVGAVISSGSEKFIYYDYWMPAMSAPGMLNINYQDLSGKPYISALPDAVAAWKNLLGKRTDKPKVGIRWSGNPKFEHEQFRSVNKDDLRKAFDDRFEVFSLHIDDDAPENTKELKDLIGSWEDTLACIMNLDLVVTTCTSIAHASAAMGKETWVIVPVMPYYVWGYPIAAKTSGWYDSVKLFRQRTFDKWDYPINGVKLKLEDFMKTWVPTPDPELTEEEMKANEGNLGADTMDGYHRNLVPQQVQPEMSDDMPSIV